MPLHRRLVRAKTQLTDTSHPSPSPSLHSTIAPPYRLKTTNSAFDIAMKKSPISRTIETSPSKHQQPHRILLKPKRVNQTMTPVNDREAPQKDKYELERVLGKGSFGVVFLGRQRNSGTAVAIKKVQKIRNVRSRELEMLRGIDHPNILKLQEHYSKIQNGRQYLYLVTKKMSCDLNSLIQSGGISPSSVKRYLFQILKALDYLKGVRIAHRDVKPENILIDKETKQAVLGDLGSAKILRSDQSNVSYIGNRAYRAPELIFGSTCYGTQVDMWSLGCVAVEMVNSVPPFRGKTTVEQVICIMRVLGTPTQEDIGSMNYCFSEKEYNKLPKLTAKSWKYQLKTSDPQLVDLISRILVYQPAKRLTPSQALSHPYFASQHNPESSIDEGKTCPVTIDSSEATIPDSHCTPVKSLKWIDDTPGMPTWNTKNRPSHNRHNPHLTPAPSSSKIFWARHPRQTPGSSAPRKLMMHTQ